MNQLPKKRRLLLFAGIVIILALAATHIHVRDGGRDFISPVLAQAGPADIVDSRTTPADPLQVEILGSRVAQSGAIELDLRLTNVSQYHIEGFVLRCELFNADGSTLGYKSQLSIPGLGRPDIPVGLDPGMTHEHVFSLGVDKITGRPPVFTTDFVLFRDGPEQLWGPDKSKLSQRIIGTLSGYRSERVRLNRLLEREGIQAVEKDLRTKPTQ